MSDKKSKVVSFEETEEETVKQTQSIETEGNNCANFPLNAEVCSKTTSELNSAEDLRDVGKIYERENSVLSREIVKEQKRRKNTIVGSFRLAELIPTSNTPFTNYRRKSSSILNAELVVDEKATEHFREGSKFLEKNDHERAISSFNKAISLKPDVTDYYTARAESFLQLCDFQSAILNYKKACILDPDNDNYYSRLAFIYFFQGQCLFDLKLYSEALESFSRAAEMKPEIIGYHTRSVACLAALQRHGECLALVNKRLEEETDNPDLYIMRARLHELFRNLTLCYYDVKDALVLDPDNAEAKSLMKNLEKRANDARQQAIEMNLLGKIKEALTKISIAIETNPSVAEYHVQRGALHRRNFDFNAAIDDYLLAMDKADHDDTNTTCKEAQRQLLLCYNDFAVECFSKGYYEEAVVLLNKAVKGEKKEKGLYINRGDCFFLLNELHFALADYQQALEMDASDWSVKSRLSVVYNEFGILEYYERHYVEAIEHLTTAISYNPKIGPYFVSRARARYMIEDHDGARSDVLMSLYLDPNNSEVISIFSRLFPGRTVNDVLNSHLGTAAAREIEVALRETFGTQLLPFANESNAKDKKSSSRLNGKSILPPIKGSVFPELMACMEEKDFHISIIKNKKKANKTVKKAFEWRQDLRYSGPRVDSQASASQKRKQKTCEFPTNLTQKSLVQSRTAKITVAHY